MFGINRRYSSTQSDFTSNNLIFLFSLKHQPHNCTSEKIRTNKSVNEHFTFKESKKNLLEVTVKNEITVDRERKKVSERERDNLSHFTRKIRKKE